MQESKSSLLHIHTLGVYDLKERTVIIFFFTICPKRILLSHLVNCFDPELWLAVIIVALSV